MSYPFEVLRVKTDPAVADTDWAALQTVPGASILRLLKPGISQPPTPMKVICFAEWLDAGGLVVTAGGRGTFDIQAIWVRDRKVVNTATGAETISTVVHDEVPLTGQIAHRPWIVTDSMPGDKFTIRIGAGAAVPAGALQLRILCAVMP